MISNGLGRIISLYLMRSLGLRHSNVDTGALVDCHLTARQEGRVFRVAEVRGMLHSLTIPYGDDILFGVGLSQDEFAEEARFLLAAKLYELGKSTSGQAAVLCGKGRVDFLLSLPRVGVSISNLRSEDADSEIEFLRNA